MKLLLLISALLILLINTGFTQQSKIDSLLNLNKTTNVDSIKIQTLLSLSDLYSFQNPDSAVLFAKRAKILAEKTHNPIYLSNACTELGWSYYVLGNYSIALENFFEALKINENSQDWKNMSTALGNIGSVYLDQKDYKKAREYYFKALTIDEKMGNSKWIASDISNLGIIYMTEGNFNKALEYYSKALKINQKIDNKRDISMNLGNIGNVYYKLGEINADNYKKSDSLNMLAARYYFEAMKMDEELGRKNGIAIKLGNLGQLYTNMKKYHEAENFLKRAIVLSDSIGAIDLLDNWHLNLSELYEKTNNPKKSLEHYKRYVSIRDSINSLETSQRASRLELTFEFERKQAIENAEQEKKDELQKAEKSKQRFILLLVLCILILVFVFAGFIYNRWRVTQKQKRIIEKQKEHIENIHQELTDSIQYAKLIQTAVLPSTEYISEGLNLKSKIEYFILFKPRNIVSGDFYFIEKRNNKLLLSVADCTGHGVPGAFMSMLGLSLIKEIITKEEIQTASQVLDELRNSVIKSLQQKGMSSELSSCSLRIQDGMDISFVVLDLDNHSIQYAGANIPLYIVSKSKSEKLKVKSVELSSFDFQLYELKPDKMPVSIYERMNPFTNHIIQLQKGDCIYLASDGYEDQFGGPKGKKIMAKSLKKTLMDNSKNSLSDQNKILDSTIENWKNNYSEKYEQTDDITIMGIKII